VLVQAAVDLANIRLDAATIRTTWEESAMPVPSFIDQLREDEHKTGRELGLQEGREEGRELGLQEGREEGLEEGLQAGRAESLASLLRFRFGSDDRIPAVARRLASTDMDELVPRIERAASLDELAGPG
jgi:flagellar biosynthesis/type III secretory pathway protein FliH